MASCDNPQQTLHQLASCDLWRTRRAWESDERTRVVIDGRVLINFCSNDYLNLATHPRIKQAFVNSAQQLGVGSGASALVSGYSASHQRLEEAFAEFLQRERALLFNSGYHANLGVITALADRHSVIVADKHCHASIIDGILLSRAKHVRYRHNQPQHAEYLLATYADARKLIISESVFSMQGNIIPVKQLAELATQHRAKLIIDDAHGLGVLGQQGRGICEQAELPAHAVSCLVSPLGKAFGSMGAVVSGDHDTMEVILQTARTYCYSTALPPAVCDATYEAIHVIKAEAWRRQQLQTLARFFIREANARNLPLISQDETPIKSMVFGSNQRVVTLQQQLMEHGLFVSCIRPPTVPDNAALIRVSLNCEHTETQIVTLLDRLADCDARLSSHDAA